jgi:hypothetical protein
MTRELTYRQHTLRLGRAAGCWRGAALLAGREVAAVAAPTREAFLYFTAPDLWRPREGFTS